MKTKVFTLIVVLCPLLLSAQWSNDPSMNTPVVTGDDSFVQPKVAIGPAGESYISWFHENTVDHQFDVYLQHLDINGNKLWGEDGLLVSNYPTATWTTDYGLAMDLGGNAVIVNRDQRTGMDNIYAWCISAEGSFIWGSDGLSLSDDKEKDYSPEVLIDQENNAVVMWEAFPLDTNEFIKTKFQKIGPDESNNQLILAWSDNRNDPQHDFKTNIYAQNIGPEGWIGPLSNDEIVVSDPGYVQVYPNPVDNIVCIEFEMEQASQVEVFLFDITGKNSMKSLTDYKTKGSYEIHFDTSDLLPGVYVLNIKTDFAFYSQRIVKQ